jgi:hypothetical protein
MKHLVYLPHQAGRVAMAIFCGTISKWHLGLHILLVVKYLSMGTIENLYQGDLEGHFPPIPTGKGRWGKGVGRYFPKVKASLDWFPRHLSHLQNRKREISHL